MPARTASHPVTGTSRRAVVALLAASAASLAWAEELQPSAELRSEGEAALARLRDAMAAQRFEEVYGMLAPNMKRRPASVDEWVQRQRRFLASAGSLLKLEPQRSFWKGYADGDDRVGIHFITEYTGSYEKIPRYYEVVILRRPPGGEFRVTVFQQTDLTQQESERLRRDMERVRLIADL